MIKTFNEQFEGTVAATRPAFRTPVLYHERSTDAQDDMNFYTAASSFSLSQDILQEAEMAAQLVQQMGNMNAWQAGSPFNQTARFNASHAMLSDIEWMRQF